MSAPTETNNDLRSLWAACLEELRKTISPTKFITWIRPLHIEKINDDLVLLAPNQFVKDWIDQHYFSLIKEAITTISKGTAPPLRLGLGTKTHIEPTAAATCSTQKPTTVSKKKPELHHVDPITSGLNQAFTFNNFIEGKSNQLGKAAASQVATNPGQAYNPLFLYGGVGLGKTHLMHAIGHQIQQNNPKAKVLYLHAERFVADMIKALQQNAMNAFKRFYRSLDALLLDDIQFFAGKERSQEELFHTFNALLDGRQQIVLTCDRYPKEVDKLEERLQSRFGWGLTVAIEPPELETRVAILVAKAEQLKINLDHDVAFFIAGNIQSNVRELEGALKRVIANAHFTGEEITVAFAQNALKDLLTLQAKLVTISNIQKVVAEYYKVKLSDLLSKKRNRSIARPRQIAMALAKQLTHRSLPEIGEAFNGRDHTTVLHACRVIKKLSETNVDIQEDLKNLLRILSA